MLGKKKTKLRLRPFRDAVGPWGLDALREGKKEHGKKNREPLGAEPYNLPEKLTPAAWGPGGTTRCSKKVQTSCWVLTNRKKAGREKAQENVLSQIVVFSVLGRNRVYGKVLLSSYKKGEELGKKFTGERRECKACQNAGKQG